MKIIRAKDYDDMSRKAANILSAQVILFVHTVNLDEYSGLPAGHPQSYRSYMDRNLYESAGGDDHDGFARGDRLLFQRRNL